MCGWDDNKFKVYLIGNPIVWWLGAASLMGFVALSGFYLLRFRRGANNWQHGQWERYFSLGKLLWLGWFLHYLPFMIMGRVTYLHHYFPSLYFAILMSAFMVDHFSESYMLKYSSVKALPHLIVATAVIAVFVLFSPLTYGFEVPSRQYAHLKWLKTWTMTD